MKRPRCTKCKHTMKGHKKQRCQIEKKIYLGDGAEYTGNRYNDKPSGKGTLLAEEYTYVGYWLVGKKHGKGIETNATGRVYDGNWRNGLYHGHGILTLENGTVYDGHFNTGTYHGHGTIILANSSYSGHWNHGTYHGHGEHKTLSGVYKGQFYFNVRHGEGTFTDNKGNIYSGKWRKGMREGRGVYTTKDDTYSGQWSHNLQSGFGRWVSKHHGIYVGEWKRGKRHRKGTQTYKDGTTYNGGWSKGKRTGFGVFTWQDGSMYEGFWLKDIYNGRGTLTMNGHSFCGEWHFGKREGIFIETLSDGTISKGPWLNDARHGTFKHADERLLYIWNTLVEFDTLKKAKKAASNMFADDDIEGARVVLEHYPSLISYPLFLKFDITGQLVHMVPQQQILKMIKTKSWKLFLEKRYAFLEKLMTLCPESKQLVLLDKVPELFDSLSKEFVANPWLVRNQSYSNSTKEK